MQKFSQSFIFSIVTQNSPYKYLRICSKNRLFFYILKHLKNLFLELILKYLYKVLNQDPCTLMQGKFSPSNQPSYHHPKQEHAMNQNLKQTKIKQLQNPYC